MKRVAKFLRETFNSRVLNMVLALLLIMVLVQPSIEVGNSRVVITFGTPEAYAAGTADHSLGTNGTVNAATIQAALNALPTQGGLFHFKVGTYNITTNASGAITRAIGNVTIEGEGRGSLFTGNGSFTAGGNQWVFRDLALNATGMISMGATTGWSWVNVYDSATLWNTRTSGTSTTNSTTTNLTTLNMAGDIVPTSNNTRSLGSSILKWLTGWFVNLVSETSNTTQLNATTANISTLNAPTGRGATYVIASSTANATVKAQADIIATGNVDDEIETAITLGYKDILLAEGSFNTSQINIGTNSGIRIRGAGMRNTTLTLAAGVNAYMFLIGNGATYTTGTTITDMTLDGENTTQTSGGLIQIWGAEDTHLERLVVLDANEYGIYSNGDGTPNSVYVYVTDCYIHDNIKSGIYMYDKSYALIAKGNTIAGNGRNADQAGIRIEGNSDHTIIGNLLDENAVGIKFISSSYTTVTGNTFLNQERDGILANSGSHDIVVTGNTIISPSVGNAGTYNGMRTDGTYITFVGNIVYALANSVDSGWKELTGATNNTVIGNTFRVGAGFAGAPVTLIANSNTLVGRNFGYVTENSGNTTMLANTNTISVTHGLASTPKWLQFSSTSNETGWLRAVSVGATTFNISSSYNVTTNTTIYWRATIGAGN